MGMDMIWPIVGAIAAGALIGLEREYHGSPAGFRTHILVSLASSLLMLAAAHQIRWLSDTPHEMIRIDPVRMAHGVLTGIGFLGAGVIFREGFNIRGLTTAASLWITASLGILFGVGLQGLAVAGTAATVIVLALLSLADGLIPQRAFLEVSVRYARAAGMTESRFRQLLARHHLKPRTVSQGLDGDVVTFIALAKTSRLPPVETLAATLGEDASVVGFDLTAHRP